MLHIDMTNDQDIAKLYSLRNDACVSIYLETTPVTNHIEGSRIEFRNLIKESLSQLEARNFDKRRMKLLDEVFDEIKDDDDFWAHQANALAVFATPDNITAFRLPNKIKSSVEVSDRFNIQPLLRSTTFSHAAHALVLSPQSVRLIELRDDGSVDNITTSDIPSDAHSVLNFDNRNDTSQIMGAKINGEGNKRDLEKFLRLVDRAISPIVRQSNIPLFLVASEPVTSIFKGLTRSNNLQQESISLSADRATDAEIADLVRPLLDKYYAAQIADEKERFSLREAKGRALMDMNDISIKATQGAIETLYIDIDSERFGLIDEQGVITEAATPSATTYSLLGEIASRALSTGAKVYALRSADMPTNGVIAATLRYV